MVFDLTPAALLLDLDGTLLDSTAAVEAAWLRLAERRGVAAEVVRPLMHGPSYNGDCGQALRDLAASYEERLTAEGVRWNAPATPAD